MGAVREDKLRKLLMGAGMYSTSPRTVQGYRVLAAAMLSGLGVLMGGSVLQRVAMAGLFAVAWLAASRSCSSSAARRHARSRSSAKPRT